MTTVNSANSTNQASLLTAASQNKGATGADFNMFLKLLTAQMQNQDPLDPMKTSEYTQQLVQYSQVEQSLQQTSTLKDILSRMTSQDLVQAAGFVGREAKFDSATTGLDAQTGTATWEYTLDRLPSSAVATISDFSGKPIRQIALDPADTSKRLVWDGLTVTGAPAPQGAYTLTVTALDSNGVSINSGISAIGTIRDVSRDGNDVMLGMNGLTLPMTSLVSVAATL